MLRKDNNISQREILNALSREEHHQTGVRPLTGLALLLQPCRRCTAAALRRRSSSRVSGTRSAPPGASSFSALLQASCSYLSFLGSSSPTRIRAVSLSCRISSCSASILACSFCCWLSKYKWTKMNANAMIILKNTTATAHR